jgi:methionyl-tRNA synthetase
MKQKEPRHILVTTALPYANGPLHLGHLVEFIQADIWVRFQRAKGNHCLFLSGDDAHGTTTMLNAEKMGVSPETLIEGYHAERKRDLADFSIELDNYYTTHSPENQALSNEIYQKLRDVGDIRTETIAQAYDPVKSIFLPDRYVKGTCPHCKTPDQYGDNCEACGATYTPADLIDAHSVISGAAPIKKESLHYFFELEHYAEFLKEWTSTPGNLPLALQNKLEEWFSAGLRAWDISRDAPYFGFEIPDAPGKYFYVWLDAPIGYMASLKNLCTRRPELSFDRYWSLSHQGNSEVYHFIGKDIVYFHALFWPAMLKGSGYRTPSAIFAHGFLTVNGQKMSKSRGTFITARDYLSVADPEYLRYYLASKLTAGIEDLDFGMDDFVQRVNSDLVGKLVNIASRTAKFINQYFDNKLSPDIDQTLLQTFVDAEPLIASAYENREYHRAIREIMKYCDRANQYVDEHKPWLLVKSPDTQAQAHAVCSTSLNIFRILMIYLSPVLPELSARAAAFLNTTLDWESMGKPLGTHEIQSFTPLLQRLDIDKVIRMIPTTPDTVKTEKTAAPINETPTISIDDFMKVDLRIAKIVSAESVPEADKLIKLQLDIGEEKPRQVFAGIKAAYPDPNALVGQLTVMVANLAPRKMRFGLSEGMVLAAGPGGSDLWILEPHKGAAPGMKVK